MRIKKYIPYLIVIGMLAVATLIISMLRHVCDESPAVVSSLPERIGMEWRGNLSFLPERELA